MLLTLVLTIKLLSTEKVQFQACSTPINSVSFAADRRCKTNHEVVYCMPIVAIALLVLKFNCQMKRFVSLQSEKSHLRIKSEFRSRYYCFICRSPLFSSFAPVCNHYYSIRLAGVGISRVPH